MTEIISVDGKSVVYGMTWVTLSDPNNEEDELAALTREAGTKLYARFEGDSVKIGMVKSGTHLQQWFAGDELYSVALLFARYVQLNASSQNCMLIHLLDERRVAIIVLIQGVPYLDFIANIENLDEQLCAIKSEVSDKLLIFVNRAQFSGKPLTAETLLSGVGEPVALKCYTRPWRKMKRLGLFGLLAVFSAGALFWKINEHKTSEAEQSKVIEPAVVYEEHIRSLLATAGFNGEAAYNSIWEMIKIREVEQGGWSLKSIKCKPSQCEELWQKGHGSFSSFKQKVYSPRTVTFAANGMSGSVRYPVTAGKTALDKSTLPKKDDAWAELTAQQQHLRQIHPGVVLNPKHAEVRGLDPSIPAGSIPAESLVYAGELTISAPLGLAAEILLHQMNNIMINEVLVDSLGEVRNARIEIKGLYYAKN